MTLIEAVWERRDIKSYTGKNLWVFLWRSLGEIAGTVRMTVRSLAKEMGESEPAVRSALKGAALGGLIRYQFTEGAVEIEVFDPSYLLDEIPNTPDRPTPLPTPLFDCLEEIEKEPEPVVEISKDSRNLFNYQKDYEKDFLEKVAKDPNIYKRAHADIYKYININSLKERKKEKKGKEFSRFVKSEFRAVEYFVEREELDSEEWKTEREWVAGSIWELGLAADLVDLTTLAILRGWTSREKITSEIKKADREIRSDFPTDRRKTKRWAFLRIFLADLYRSEGFNFPTVSGVKEPRPKPKRRPVQATGIPEPKPDGKSDLVILGNKIGITPEEPIEESERKLKKEGIVGFQAKATAVAIRSALKAA